ncbi:histone-lysine N-methyltransferase ATXR6-like [Papaver somniferum]|uniref:histone-lysine N-methyltransferase ATXR6-like n=1 Tax=Papaver somniferum TaxID=3469 RepID=UPI000E6FAA98|nr:histone-lysine N-methyltransferase ATXR6-like [Papaver somniferum]
MAAAKILKRKRFQALNPLSSAEPQKKTHQKIEEDEEYDDTHCEECGSGDNANELLLCDECDLGFHLYCLRPILVSVPKDSWYCAACTQDKKIKKFPLVQTKIVDFFRIQRSSDLTQKPCKDIRKRRKSLVMSKKKRKLLAFNPTEDPERRLGQMASLATALTTTGTKFSNYLTYVDGLAPRSANNPTLEDGGMQGRKEETES